MKNVFLFIFLISATLLYSQDCYKSSDGKFLFILNSQDNKFFFKTGYDLDMGFYHLNKKGDLISSDKHDYSFKIRSDSQISVLGSALIKVGEMDKYECSEKEISFFNLLFDF